VAQRSYNHSFRQAFGPLMYLLLWLRLHQRDAADRQAEPRE